MANDSNTSTAAAAEHNNDKPPADLITVKRASQIAHVHENTTRKWIKRGILRAWLRTAASNQYLVSRAEVQALISRFMPKPWLRGQSAIRDENPGQEDEEVLTSS